MEFGSSVACPAHKGNKMSTIPSSSCAYEAIASGGITRPSKDKALFKTIVNSFQTGANLLHFQISLTYSSDAVGQGACVTQSAICGFVVFGSFRRDLLSILTIAGRHQDDEAILCPFNKLFHFFSCSFFASPGVGQEAVKFVLRELLSLSLSLVMTNGACSNVVDGVMSSTYAQHSSSVAAPSSNSVITTRRANANATGASHTPCRKPSPTGLCFCLCLCPLTR